MIKAVLSKIRFYLKDIKSSIETVTAAFCVTLRWSRSSRFIPDEHACFSIVSSLCLKTQ